MAEDSSAAIQFRDDYVTGEGGEPDQTKLMTLRKVWMRLFPGRHIDFAGHHPIVQSKYSSTSGDYPAQNMSDGERVALYLAARVLDSEGPVIVVDEPEVHFHSRLAARFWNTMEGLRDDCRFLYVTHDLPFALSRTDATYVVIMPDSAPQVVPLDKDIPRELAESLLAAASFSIFARRIIFCEGAEGASLDQALYTAWFNTPDTAVVPVETSDNVIRCSKTFGESKLVTGVVAEGLVDRDYWPEKFLRELPPEVQPLEAHEVENLFCLPGVFNAVAKHLGRSEDDADAAYSAFLEDVRRRFDGELLAKQLTERVKRRCEHEFRRALNSAGLISEPSSPAWSPGPDAWETPVEAIIEEEQERLTEALSGSAEQVNKYFPGKVFIGKVAEAAGVTKARYCELVCTALAGANDELNQLAHELQEALSEYLPNRTFETE